MEGFKVGDWVRYLHTDSFYVVLGQNKSNLLCAKQLPNGLTVVKDGCVYNMKKEWMEVVR
jgi:hypothetical protein